MSKVSHFESLSRDTYLEFEDENSEITSSELNSENGISLNFKKPIEAVINKFDLATNLGSYPSDAAPEVHVLVRRKDSLPFAPYYSNSLSRTHNQLWKRAFDLVVASIMLLLAFPFMIAIWALVRLTSPGPGLYSQSRLTQGGKIFMMYKFRSMLIGAEKGIGAVWAKEKDPRITLVGRFIRKTRLDELPQLVNIIRGEMSLVGPRPERPELAKDLRDSIPNFDSRLAVKAGLTGLAQVTNGYCASESSYKKKLALDRVYIQNQGVLLDLWIMLKTVFTVTIGGSSAR